MKTINKEKKSQNRKFNQLIIPTYWYEMEDGSIHYDFDCMAEEFEKQLSKLDKNVVIKCIVETKINK